VAKRRQTKYEPERRQMNAVMRTTKTDEKCLDLLNQALRTKEAVARWMQGKVNWAEEMAKLELEIYEIKNQLQCAMWCLNKAKGHECYLRGELERWRNCARQLAALGMSKDFQNSAEWNKAMEFYRKLQSGCDQVQNKQDSFESPDHDNDDYTYAETYNPQQTR
jgi:small-conductance mechanosensitive channel